MSIYYISFYNAESDNHGSFLSKQVLLWSFLSSPNNLFQICLGNGLVGSLNFSKYIMKKYVNATEGAIIYGISKSRIMVLAAEAGAVYKVGNSALINTDIFEMYLEKFKEPTRPLPLLLKPKP